MIDGLVVVDKPSGWTSHDVVARCRKIFGQKRVGHAGTLDPDATGVLLVGLGRATRLIRFLAPLRKHYVGEVVLGVATSTLDSSGEVVGEWDMSGVSLDDVRAAASKLEGEILQVPPMVSAVQIGGKRLHDLARQGIEVDRAPRPVCVHRFAAEAGGEPGVFRVTVECSSGTYVRTLAADLGAALGGGAHLRNLRRTRVGSFGVEQAVALDALTTEDSLPPAEAMRDLERVVVDDAAAVEISFGRRLSSAGFAPSGDGPWALVDASGALLAVYEAGPLGAAVPAVVLAPR